MKFKIKLLLMVFSFILLQACFHHKQTTPVIPHQVLSGENLNAIINLYGISDNDVEVLIKFNDLQPPDYYIRVGDTLYVPKYMILKPKSCYQKHVVVKGDNVYSLTRKYGLSKGDIDNWNNLKDSNQLSIGQRLIVSPPNNPACSQSNRR
ncbi:LysM peptidoglycan-binding domain-containing protein [Candidatus Halobeggiatoa sp. HSG11]|nr:LysM peptidoglycan-binding domain-containing protein [Candidatus Halobeggiatoa sp. HSG11]